MHFIDISGTKYGDDELSSITARNFVALGMDSFQSIDINTKNNSIRVGFENIEDANSAYAIAGQEPQSTSKIFHSWDAKQFILQLSTVAESWCV